MHKLSICKYFDYKDDLLIYTLACGGFYHSSNYLYSTRFSIESPGYPEAYTTGSVCRYEIRGRFPDYGVRFEFKTFDLEASPGCQKDNLTIYKGSISSTNIESVKCGNETGDFISSAQNLFAVFKSSSNFNGKGFYINVERKYAVNF